MLDTAISTSGYANFCFLSYVSVIKGNFVRSLALFFSGTISYHSLRVLDRRLPCLSINQFNGSYVMLSVGLLFSAR